jgi:ABC-type amino acid transport substrate-binding protein
LPRDPEKTLQHVQQRHVIRVGLVESPPWIIRSTPEPSGIEVQLMREFAQSLSAAPQWFWDTDQRDMEALEHYQLDLVIANLDAKTPWAKTVGLTPPYFDERRAFLPGTPSRPIERKHVIAVPPGENGWLYRLAAFLQQHKSEVQPLLDRARTTS